MRIHVTKIAGVAIRDEKVFLNIQVWLLSRILFVWQLSWPRTDVKCKYEGVVRQNKQNDCAPSEDSDQPGHWFDGLSLCAQWVAKDPNFLHADSEDSDETGRMPRLIWVFAGRTCHFVGFVMWRLISFCGHQKFQIPWNKLMIRQLGRAKRICYLSPMRAAKVQASLRIRAVSPEPPLLAHTSSESRGTFRQKARSIAPLNGWACAVEICHDGMLEDTNSLDGAQLMIPNGWDGF